MNSTTDSSVQPFKVPAVVYKEHTLGTLSSTFGKPSIEVLNGLASKGGKSIMDSPILFVSEDDFRPASLRDFEVFGVVYSDCYITQNELSFD